MTPCDATGVGARAGQFWPRCATSYGRKPFREAELMKIGEILPR
jgi:hypothetical protein